MKAIVTVVVAICSLSAVAQHYLFFNEGAEASSDGITSRSEGRRAEIWDPQTGKTTTAKATSANGAVEIQLELKPYETKVVVVR
jgi:hypothetical protein